MTVNAQLVVDLKNERDKYSALAHKFKVALEKVLNGPWGEEVLTAEEEVQAIKDYVAKTLSE